jgi:hypothetical protein
MAISRYCATRFKPHYVEYVYSLRHPVTMEIYYVGKTVDPISRRYAHCGTTGYNLEKDAITAEIIGLKMRPIMRFIDQTEVRTAIDRFHAEYKEAYWINRYIEMGWKLTNKQWVGVNLNCTDWVMNYIRYFIDEEEVPLHLYYFRLDSEGLEIYDRQRRLADGFNGLWSIQEPKQPEYDPWRNHRFIAKNGFKFDPDDLYTYYPIYKDTDPNYYNDDY